MVNHAIGTGHHEDAFFAQLFERHVQSADRHGGGDGDLLRRHAGRDGIDLLLVERRQRKSVADGQLAFQRRGLLHGFHHIVHRRHARRAGFMQVNIHPFVVIERNLEHGIERFLHRAIDVSRVEAADIMGAGLHRFANQ